MYRMGMGFDQSDLNAAVSQAQNKIGTAGLFMLGLLAMVGIAVWNSARGR